MQKKLVPLFLLFISNIALAQTITSSINPQNGNTYVYFNCDSVGPGPSGSGVTWQYFAMNCPTSATFSYQNCPGAPDCATFTGSNRAMVSGANTGAYYIADANRFAWNGERATSTVAFIYSDPRDVRRYPMQYGNNWTDTHESTFTSGTNWTRRGTLTATVDAAGTLMLPSQSYAGTLRVHYVDEYTDSNHVTTLANRSYIREVYDWYFPGYNEYLMHLEKLTTLPSMIDPDTMTITTVIYTGQFPNGVNEVGSEDRIHVYPIPSYDLVTVVIQDTENSQSIELMDITGRKIASANCMQGRTKYQFETVDIPAGIYLIKVNTINGIMTRKVEIL